MILTVKGPGGRIPLSPLKRFIIADEPFFILATLLLGGWLSDINNSCNFYAEDL